MQGLIWDVVGVFTALWSVFSFQAVLLVHGQEGKFTHLILRTKYCSNMYYISSKAIASLQRRSKKKKKILLEIGSVIV